MSVLIVDDSSFIRSTIEKVVLNMGIEVVGLASNGEEALELIERLEPELMTLDMVLPDMTGLDVLRAVKTHYPDLKVIMITTMAKPSMIEEAKALGVDKYLTKPVIEEELVNVIGGFNEYSS